MSDSYTVTSKELREAPYQFTRVNPDMIPKSPWKFIAYVSKPYPLVVIATIAVTAAAQILGSTLPYFYKRVIDAATLAQANGFTNLDEVWYWAGLVIAGSILVTILWRISGFVGIKWMIAQHSSANQALFEYLSKHSYSYFSNRFAGTLSAKVNHGADGAAELQATAIWTALPGVISVVITITLAALTSVWLALLFIALVAIVLPINALIVKYRRPHVVAYADAKSITSGRLVDTVTNIFAVQYFARRAAELKAFTQYINFRAAKDWKQAKIGEFLVTVNAGLMLVCEVVIIFFTLLLWSRGAATLGDFIMITTLVTKLDETMTFIGHTMNRFVRSYGQVQDALDTILVDHEVEDVKGAKKLIVRKGEIACQTVTFRYNESSKSAKVFENLNLVITPHQKVGLVGESGAGKTTLVSLLLRQHNLTGGQILIDGQDIARVKQDSLRENIAVVPQEPMLFHRSTMENIRYGRPSASDAEVFEAAKKARAHDFIMDTAEGYDTMVGERGVKLSGGQRQRIAIARAILKNAPILVLDEATSALDSESEVLIQKALHNLMEGKTVIAVAHRLSTLREMDRILVLDKGAIVQDGSHRELVEEEGIYRRLWAHQAGGFIQDE